MSTVLNPQDSRYSADELYSMIHNIVAERGCSASEACVEVHAQLLAKEKELKNWFRYHGIRWLRDWEIAQSNARLGMPAPVELRIESSDPPKQRASRWSPERGFNPLDAVIAIGNSGVRKALRDITAADARELSERYIKCGQTMMRRGEAWGAVAQTLEEKKFKTLGSAKKGTFSAAMIAVLSRQDKIAEALTTEDHGSDT